MNAQAKQPDQAAQSDPTDRYPLPEIAGLPDDLREKILAVQDKAGFVPNVAQSENSLLGMRLLIGGLPCLGFLLGALLFRGFPRRPESVRQQSPSKSGTGYHKEARSDLRKRNAHPRQAPAP